MVVGLDLGLFFKHFYFDTILYKKWKEVSLWKYTFKHSLISLLNRN